MYLAKDTYQQQSDLATYCRSGKLSDNLEVLPRRVKHYRRLVYNVVNDSLVSAFPLTVDFLSQKQWNTLVNDFFSRHKSQSARVWEMPKEFCEFFSASPTPLFSTYPFLTDLLWFEWFEIEIFMMEDQVFQRSTTDGDLLKDPLLINPEHRILPLSYPVHLKNARKINPDEKGAYYVLLFRETGTGKVQFLDISAYFSLLIDNLKKGYPLFPVLKEFQQHMDGSSLEQLIENTLPFINKLREIGFVMGFKENQ
ncbi:MAG: putative DNA-binding domain-containing protein [Bacteroidales bacterium]|nr:putative DNA-binding domain-containing protein [Bacteroidales bacterium]